MAWALCARFAIVACRFSTAAKRSADTRSALDCLESPYQAAHHWRQPAMVAYDLVVRARTCVLVCVCVRAPLLDCCYQSLQERNAASANERRVAGLALSLPI